MRHFSQLRDADVADLFLRAPEEFERGDDPDTLAVALGATLYMPATRPRLANDLVKQARNGVMSSVLCLEDAISDAEVPAAADNIVSQLRDLGERDPERATTPLTFVRVREPQQIVEVTRRLGEHADLLSGFVLPKFTDENGAELLEALLRAREESGLPLLAMPVIESPEAIHRESRVELLLAVSRLLAKHRETILAVRLGATDLSAAYGLRRSRDLTVYDVPLVAEVIMDVVNVLGRADGTGFVVTGPVWEYFADQDRLFKPSLRETPFEEQGVRGLRQRLVSHDLDGLIREIVLDKANGLTGKTVIHPTHVLAVHALSAVTHEEWSDSCDILGTDMSGGGVRASAYRNKMNEAKPHRAWAERIQRRARLFGVLREDTGVVELLAAGVSVM
ncbi:MAG: HpcH/HpaI aldolase/citrate lyase family protein [Nocardioides sp.]|nr:HpcH/HpaI aldolase/citrate lyase family protein [Nocardioides sp.]